MLKENEILKNFIVFDYNKNFGVDVDYAFNTMTKDYRLVSVEYLKKEDLK